MVASVTGCAPDRGGFPQAESNTPTPSETPSPTPTPTPTPTFDTEEFSITDAASYWVVANKLRPLQPLDWTPPDIVNPAVKYQNPPGLRQAAADALEQMFAASVAEGGGEMQVQSAYRSYGVQVNVYNRYVSQLGQAQADNQSARPGHSEHQTGLAVDISSVPLSCALQACFGQTPQGMWLAENSWRFGFILRYPDGLTGTTGYMYEPWHYRYVGVELATEMHEQGIPTLEGFFGLPDAPTYAG